MNKTVGDIMTPNPITVKAEIPLKNAIEIIAQNRIGGLPVINAENKLIGILSETDLMWQETGISPPAYIMLLDSVIYLQNPGQYERDLHKVLGQTVGEVMTKNPISIQPEKSVKEAAKLLNDKKINRLPVLNSAGEIIGIISKGDIIRAMAGNLE